MKEAARNLAEAIRVERYPEASAFFLGGSIIRGEGTEHSDLDIVVIFQHVPAAYRESFLHSGTPVEAFVHDPATLAYFFNEVDRPSGVPSLPAMICEGIPLPESSAFSDSLKRLAQAVLDQGPPPWDSERIDQSRYHITGLVDDLRDVRPRAQTTAVGAELYSALADHIFRSRGIWSATGKAIPRRLQELSPTLAQNFETAFSQLFGECQVEAAITLAEDVLRSEGGWLFEGYRSVAPETWRSDGDEA